MNDFKPSDEIEQAFHEGYETGVGDKSRTETMIREIATYYGYPSQSDITLEECAELQKAILKLRRGWSKKRYRDLQGEIADVLIMARQLRFMCGAEEIDKIVTEKLVRQLERIEALKDNEEQR